MSSLSSPQETNGLGGFTQLQADLGVKWICWRKTIQTPPGVLHHCKVSFLFQHSSTSLKKCIASNPSKIIKPQLRWNVDLPPWPSVAFCPRSRPSAAPRGSARHFQVRRWPGRNDDLQTWQRVNRKSRSQGTDIMLPPPAGAIFTPSWRHSAVSLKLKPLTVYLSTSLCLKQSEDGCMF